jgi:hypothetical protein
MNIALASVLLLGLLGSPSARADEAEALRPHWVIIATIIDRTTGAQLQQSRLGGRELEFDDLGECTAIIHRTRLVSNEHVAAVLTCKRIDPAEAYL